MNRCIRAFSDQKEVEILEMSVQLDHVQVIAMIPAKLLLSDCCGILKGRAAIRGFNKFNDLKKEPYWGNHFWAEDDCVVNVGLDSEMIREYIQYQENKKRRDEQQPRLS